MNNNIVKIACQNSCYIDDDFYIVKMDEIAEKTNNGISYPVKILSVDISWLFDPNQEQDGLKFLRAMIDKDNVEVFKIKSIEMIVEFLFSSFKIKLYTN